MEIVGAFGPLLERGLGALAFLALLVFYFRDFHEFKNNQKESIELQKETINELRLLREVEPAYPKRRPLRPRRGVEKVSSAHD